MNHVLTQGHRRIAVLTDRIGGRHFPGCRSLAQVPMVAETYLAERFTGYRDALRAHAVDAAAVTVIEAPDIDMASGMAAAAELIACARPTAVVTTSDVHAAAVLKVLRGLGIAVPREVSVIGFDDAPIADLLGLTTIRQPLEDKGRTAAQMLLDVIAGHQRRRSVKPVELVVRNTTGPVVG